jgi:cysteine desulfurase / selenocysteine lyase
MLIDRTNDMGSESGFINPTVIAQIASRLFNEFPGADFLPQNEQDIAHVDSWLSNPGVNDDTLVKHVRTSTENKGKNEIPGYNSSMDVFSKNIYSENGIDNLLKIPISGNYPKNTALASQPNFNILLGQQNENNLGNHADNLVNQQTYSSNKDGSYGLKHLTHRSQPLQNGSLNGEGNNALPYLKDLETELPSDDILNLTFLNSNGPLPQQSNFQEPAHAGQFLNQIENSGQFLSAPNLAEGKCLAQQIFEEVSAKPEGLNFESLRQSFQKFASSVSSGIPFGSSNGFAFPSNNLPVDFPFGLLQDEPSISELAESKSAFATGNNYDLYYLKSPSTITNVDIFDVAAVRKDFPVLNQQVHGKPLIWLDNAATTQKPVSVINAVTRFYATDNSNIHRAAHTLAARATDAYENAREKIRQFIGAGSSSEIIYVRGTTEGINLVAQTWGRKFIQPGDEIVLTQIEHHANIVPWQMLAKEKGAIIRVVPINDDGEIILEEYGKLLGPRTRFVSLTQASNGLGTIVPVKEMIQMAKRFNARVLIDGAQSVAHIPANVQDLDADFFVFSGHKIFSPNGIGALYGKRELLEIMPPWHGGGNMIRNVTFEETTYNDAPAKFEAGTPNVADAIGLGAALDYVNHLGIENIARYEHRLTEYGMQQLSRIPGLRLIGTSKNKVGILSFVLKNIPNEEVGKYLDQQGIAVRAGHHCAQPALRRFGVESTVRPSLAFYNTKEEIDQLAFAIRRISRL